MSAPRVLVDGVAAGNVPASDRGYRYGDGLFETLRIAAGQPVWWDAHIARLARGCELLGIDMPDPALLAGELGQLCGEDACDGVLRLSLSRDDDARGYLSWQSRSRRVLALSPLPPRPDAQRAAGGLSVGWGTLRLAIQPRLAGLKHMNRLEQVLAARDCAAAGTDEAVLCDSEGAVTCGIAGNLFLVRDGLLETPLLDRCGVAGTCRAWILAARPDCRVARLTPADLEQADELFLCNSVRGILPVARLAGRTLPVGPLTRALAQQLAREVPAFAMEGD